MAAVDAQGLTALHHAALAGNAPTVALLLLRGAVVHVPDGAGRDALQCATDVGCRERLAAAQAAQADKQRVRTQSDALRSAATEPGPAADHGFLSRIGHFFNADKAETTLMLNSFLKRRPSISDVQGIVNKK